MKIAPNSPTLYNLTNSEKIWILSNIIKDEEEETEKIKTILKVLKPEAFKNEDEIEVTEAPDMFFVAIEEKIGRTLTDSEKYKIKNDEQYNLETLEDEVDIIKRV